MKRHPFRERRTLTSADLANIVHEPVELRLPFFQAHPSVCCCHPPFQCCVAALAPTSPFSRARFISTSPSAVDSCACACDTSVI
eukprot:261334-Chlamydomonas_euryale.AAC.7